MTAAFRALATGGGTSGTTDRTATISPAVGDLLVVFVAVATNTNNTPTCSDNNGGSYTLITKANWSGDASRFAVFVRTALIPNTTSTVVTAATGSNDAGHIHIVAVSGMSWTGAAAIRSSGVTSNITNIADASLNQTSLTENPTLFVVCSNGTAALDNYGPPSGWTLTRSLPDGQTTPTVTIESAYRDSGFAGTYATEVHNLAWLSGTTAASIFIELDGSEPPLTWNPKFPEITYPRPASLDARQQRAFSPNEILLADTPLSAQRAYFGNILTRHMLLRRAFGASNQLAVAPISTFPKIAVTQPTAAITNNANTTTYAFAAFTPVPNALLVCLVFSTGSVASAPTMTSSAAGVSWQRCDQSQLYNTTDTAYAFYAQVGPNPVSTTFTFNCPQDASTGVLAVMFQVTGHNILTPIAQVKMGANAASSNPTVTFANARSTNNATVAGFANGNNPPTSTPPAGWTEIADTGTTLPTSGISAAYRAGGETGTSVTFTAATSAWACIALEINAEGVGVAPPPPDVRYTDSVRRPMPLAAHQMPFAINVRPERTFTAFDVEYPDAVTRPSFHARHQERSVVLGDIPRATPNTPPNALAANGITCLAWYANLFVPGGTATWADSMGNAPTWTQSTSTMQPSTTTLSSGNIVLNGFESANIKNMLNSAATPGIGGVGTGEYVWAAVAKCSDTQTSVDQEVWGAAGYSNPTFAGRFELHGAASNSATIQDSQFHRIILHVVESTGVAKLYVDNVLQATQGTGASLRSDYASTFNEILSHNGTSSPFTGSLGSMTFGYTAGTVSAAAINALDNALLEFMSGSAPVVTAAATFPEAVRRPSLSAAQQRAPWFDPNPITVVVVPTQTPTSFPDLVRRPALHVSQQLAITSITPRSDAASYSPAIENLTGWYAPDYNTTSWVGRPSAGPSGGRIMSNTAGITPATGATIDGYVSASFDGVDDYLRDPTLATNSYFNTAAYTMVIATKPTSTGPAPSAASTPYLDQQIVGASGDAIGISWTNGGVRAWHVETGTFDFTGTPLVPCDPNLFHTLVVRYDGTRLSIQVDGSGSASIAKGNISTASLNAAVPRIGAGRITAGLFPAQTLLEVCWADSDLGGAACSKIVEYMRLKYPTAFPPAVEMGQRAWYPEVVRRPLFESRHQLAFATSQVPERSAPQADTEYPDVVRRPNVLVAHQPTTFTTSMQPERVTSQADTEYPDIIRRPVVPPSQQLANTEIPPFPERRSPLADVVYPATVIRYMTRAVDQPFVTGEPPQPERVQQLADVVYPATVVRPAMLPVNQLVNTNVSPLPERTLQIADVVYPATVIRPFFDTRQQLVTTSLSPLPERPAALADVIFPARIVRPTVQGAHQPPSFATSMSPERVTPLADVYAPERVVRPIFWVGNQLATTVEPPQPEQPLPLSDVRYPERIVRPVFLSYLQDTGKVPPFQQVAATTPVDLVRYPDFLPRQALRPTEWSVGGFLPEQPLPLADVRYPSVVVRPAFLTAFQLETTRIPPQPERTLQQADTEYPDVIRRPVFRPEHQIAVTELPPAPERTAIITDTVYPARLIRPSVLVQHQQAVTTLAPQPEEVTVHDWSSTYVDRVIRPSIAVANQLGTAFYPTPERTLPLADVVYPATVIRPAFNLALQLETTRIYPQPERTLQQADVEYPDVIRRPVARVVDQLACTSLSPQPERIVQLADVKFPDRVTRPVYATATQLALTSISPLPEETVFHDWNATFPDRVVRPQFLTAAQQAVVLHPSPERVYPIADVVYPSTVTRPSYEVRQQLAVTQISPAPERNVPVWDVIFPTRIVRPSFDVSQQIAAPTFSPKPEEQIQLAWREEYPARIDRSVFPVHAQRATTFDPFPIISAAIIPVDLSRYPDSIPRVPLVANQRAAWYDPNPIFFTAKVALTSYPDRIERPKMPVAHQLAPGDLAPRPERTQVLADVVYPVRIDRAIVRTVDQLALAQMGPQPERRQSLADVVYPVRIDRVLFRAVDQLALGVMGPQPERKQTLADVWFPARIDRATYPTTQQLPVTNVSPRSEQPTQISDVRYPERIVRPAYPTNLQLPVTPPPQPEVPSANAWSVSYPDRVLRGLQPVITQPSFAFAPLPVTDRLHVDLVRYPDVVVRPFFEARQQLAVTEIYPQPELPTQIASTTYPSEVRRPTFVGASQQATAFNPSPIRNIDPVDLTRYPDRIERPVYPVRQQQPFTLAPLPEQPQDWTPSYPERVLRDWYVVANQSAFVYWPVPIRNPDVIPGIIRLRDMVLTQLILRPHALADIKLRDTPLARIILMSNTLNDYDVDDVAEISAEFRVARTGVLTNPTTLVVTVKPPSANAYTMVYGVDAGVIRDATGLYRIQIPLSESKAWKVEVKSTGAVAGMQPYVINVRERLIS